MKKGAILSDCGYYRYRLWRVWNPQLDKVLFVMLNPSKADASEDDPTIRRCIAFAKQWGYGGFYVANLYAYRATDPKELRHCFNPHGELNWPHFIAMTRLCKGPVVCGWGNSSPFRLVAAQHPVFNVIPKKRLHHLGLTKSGNPRHPLFVKGDTQLIPYFKSVNPL